MRMILRIQFTLLVAGLATSTAGPTVRAQVIPSPPALGPRYSAPSYAVPSYLTQASALVDAEPTEPEPAKPVAGPVEQRNLPEYELGELSAFIQQATATPFVEQKSPPNQTATQPLANQPSQQVLSPFAHSLAQTQPQPLDDDNPFKDNPIEEDFPGQGVLPTPGPERTGPITAPGEPLPPVSEDRLPPAEVDTPQPAPPFPAPQQEPAPPAAPTAESVSPSVTSSAPQVARNSTLGSLLNVRPNRSRQNQRLPLASVPGMFGDFLEPQIELRGINGAQRMQADVPLGGGGRRLKIAENNSALPTSRAVLGYNGFSDALSFDADTATAGGASVADVNRFAFGFEMADRSESWSWETRFTLAEHYAGAGDQFSLEGSGLGNAMIGFKRLLLTRDNYALTAGIGFDFPTGGDAIVNIGAHRLAVKNDAIHAMPYFASVYERGPFFFQGFSQADLTLSGNGVEAYDDCLCTTGGIGQYTEQNFWHNDLAVGVWLLRDGHDLCYVKGLALLAEFHHTSALNDSDLISHTFSLGESVTLSNPANRVDPTNLTFGIHTLLPSNTEVRLGVVIPVTDGDDRWFESEWMLQINQRL